MGMHQGIDLSRFKKISSDAKTSTLRHSKGHEIKIAHSALSPKMFEQLKGMPVHLAGGTPKPLEAPIADDREELLTDIEPQVQNPQQMKSQAPTMQSPQMAKPPLSVDIDGPSSYYASNEPAATPEPQQPAFGTPDEDMAEHVKYANDLATKKIDPKTYQSLYGKQDTLGKIGTLFGLMLSGAGSGLAHQSNMVMDMMNKEIDNDMAAQKADRENARNWLSVQHAHDVQKAQARGMDIKNLGDAVGTSEMLKALGTPGADSYLSDYLKTVTPATAKGKALIAAADKLDQSTANNQRANAMVKQVIIPKAHEEATQGIANAHAQLTSMQQAKASQQARQGPIDEQKLNQAIYRGKIFKGKGFAPPPNSIDPDDIPKIDKEKGDLNGHRALVDSYDQGYHELAQLKNGGENPFISPATTAASGALGALAGPVVAGVAGAIGHTVGKVGESYFNRKRNIIIDNLRERLASFPGMSDDAKERLINSMVPGISDDPKDYESIYNRGMAHLHDIEKKMTPTLDRYAKEIPDLKQDFPEMSYNRKKKKK